MRLQKWLQVENTKLIKSLAFDHRCEPQSLQNKRLCLDAAQHHACNFGESLQKHILALGTKVSIGLSLHTKIGGSSRVDVSAPVVVAKTCSPYNHILHFGCTAKKPTVSLGQQSHSNLEMSLARWFIYRCNSITRCKIAMLLTKSTNSTKIYLHLWLHLSCWLQSQIDYIRIWSSLTETKFPVTLYKAFHKPRNWVVTEHHTHEPRNSKTIWCGPHESPSLQESCHWQPFR